MPSSKYKDSACKSSRHSQNQKFITWNGVVINNQDIEQFYGASHSCQVKTQPQTKYLLTKLTPLPKRALEMLAVKHQRPLPVGESYLVFVDYYSRFPFIFILPSETCRCVVNCLIHLFINVGYPNKLNSNNGSQFRPQGTKLFLKQQNIHHLWKIPY